MGLAPGHGPARFAGSLLALLVIAASTLAAAPMLRLANSTVGPVELPVAGATDTPTLEAYNVGDGSLNLSLASSVPWIVVKLGAARGCTQTVAAKTCLPIQFTIGTAGLPQGLSSGTVTVSDPNAIDAPQTVAVLVRIGPVSVYAAPGTTRGVRFAASTYISSRATTKDGADWLSVACLGNGSFLFDVAYQVRFQPPASMAAGAFSGSFNIFNSTNPLENQTIPVSMQVTTQPIAVAATGTTFAPQPASDGLAVRLAAGAPPLIYPFAPTIFLNNAGQGTLAVQKTAITGTWLKQDSVAGSFAIDPTGLSPGNYSGSVAFTSNAANGAVSVPVNLQIVPKGPPLVYYRSVVNTANFQPGDTVAQGDILLLRGEQLSFSPATPKLPLPLPTQAGGTSVLVNGTAVPLFYTSYGEISFQLPYNVPAGTALVQVKRNDGSTSNQVSVSVVAIAPRLLMVVNTDGSTNSPAHPAHSGDAVTIYAIGLGATTPPVAAGVAAPSAEPLARVPARVGFGYTMLDAHDTAPTFAGLTPNLAGRYQLNVALPQGIVRDTIGVWIVIPGVPISWFNIYVTK